MLTTTIKVSQDILEKLGEAGVRDVCACLWAADCQTCGRFLGDEPPALVVDDSLATATASLHHLACRTPVWNDSGVIVRIPEDNLSWLSIMLSFPVLRLDGDQEYWPMLLVNPGLEQVPLLPDGQGGFQVLRSAIRDLPASRMGRDINAPLSGAVATLTADSVSVTFALGRRTYTAPAEEFLLESVRALGGVLVVPTVSTPRS